VTLNTSFRGESCTSSPLYQSAHRISSA